MNTLIVYLCIDFVYLCIFCEFENGFQITEQISSYKIENHFSKR